MISKELGNGFLTAKYDTVAELPIVVLVNKFDEGSAKAFREEMDKAENSYQSIIPIVIDSFGGSVYALLSMIDTIGFSKKRICTIVTGKAMSCGAVLFTCGTQGYRYMSPLSTFLIHDVSSIAFGKVEEIKADAAEASRLDTLIYSIMDKNCGKAPGYFKGIVHDKGHADWYLTSEDCIFHGITNFNHLPKFKAQATVSFDIVKG